MSNLNKILDHEQIAKNTFKMQIEADTKTISKPGQFINIKLNDSYKYLLRRPISINSYDESSITIIYKVLGEGTAWLKERKQNEYLDLLFPLGNGFTINKELKKQTIIGGGIGIPPLYDVAKELQKNNIDCTVILGFNTKEDIFLENEFKALGFTVEIATMDGSYGFKGNVLELISNSRLEVEYYYACGPEVMLNNIVKMSWNGQLSYEERMGCGFGTCMGCSHKTKKGYKRVCTDGPVFLNSEVLLDE